MYLHRHTLCQCASRFMAGFRKKQTTELLQKSFKRGFHVLNFHTPYLIEKQKLQSYGRNEEMKNVLKCIKMDLRPDRHNTTNLSIIYKLSITCFSQYIFWPSLSWIQLLEKTTQYMIQYNHLHLHQF